mmetsp:Transcript_41500/g.76688  ORF Transcript_41500/g.76688 Transcript_41500/m.76688 type:complete len:88 (-) Transcript_41500:84-347(-)
MSNVPSENLCSFGFDDVVAQVDMRYRIAPADHGGEIRNTLTVNAISGQFEGCCDCVVKQGASQLLSSFRPEGSALQPHQSESWVVLL